MKARDILSVPRGTAIAFPKWIEQNKAAREFVETWISMREGGETDWAARQVLNHLRREFGCQSRTENSFLTWLESRHADFYRRHIAK